MAEVPGGDTQMVGDAREVQYLREQSKLLETNVERAAEIGKMLLEENEALKEKIEEISKANEKKLEMADQEKYDLQMKLDQKTSMEDWFNEEITHLRQQLAIGQDNLRKTLENEKNTEISKLTRQIDEVRADLEHQHHTEAMLHRKNEELEELLQERLNQTEATASKSFSSSEELGLLQEEVAALQAENTGLKSQMIEKKSELQSVQSECDTLRGKLICRDEELDDIRCQFTAVNNALENARTEKLDLNCQLDALRMETSNHKKKGNSIFSEVEDRRVQAEKKLISLQTRCETLTEKFNIEKQQNHKYKRQISQLLMQMSTGKVDNEYVEDLNTKLIQARHEIRELMENNKQLQEKQECVATTMPEFSTNNDGSDQDYVVYLQTLISGKEKELQKVKEELRTKNLQLLDEQSRTTTQNSRIQQIEGEKDKIRSLNVKLQMKLDQLRMKYEPESVRKSGALVVKRTEKIPVEESTVKITETSHIHDNSTINQSQRSFHQADKQQTQPLVERQTENIQNGPIIKKKGKTVSISDEIEEHEITCERSQQDESVTENTSEPGNRPKGRRLTTVKHITASKQPTSQNDCKTQ